MDERGIVDGDTTAIDEGTTTVEWRETSAVAVPSPIVRQVPYLELKLEHPDLESSGHADRFFPDVVPYDLDGTARVFYWRPSIASPSVEPHDWQLACATTHELVGFDSLPADGPPLVTEGARGTTVVVDGTVGGDATTCHVTSYVVPGVSVDGRSASTVELTVEGTGYKVPAGDRRRIQLSERRVEPLDGGEPTTVTPEFVVRYPGRRELHHPASGASYRLFPSFGLDLDEVSNPLAVPTTADELDDAALATNLGVDLSRRPYPERVLWQAFAYTAFDPHADATPELTQLESGHIVLLSGNFCGG
ncbi:MAG: hypothetical protein ABEI98_08315 [Halorhabdus sp.]